jgi:hypothetical protein
MNVFGYAMLRTAYQEASESQRAELARLVDQAEAGDDAAERSLRAYMLELILSDGNRR